MNRWAWIFVLIFIGSWLFYYPPLFTFSDEGQYLHATWLFSGGKSLKVVNPLESFAFSSKDNLISLPQYAPGQSLLLLPFAIIGWRFVFLSGLLLHLLVFYLFVRLLKQNNLNSDYALLYLLFPGFVFFSRTVMSELVSIVLVFLGFYFYRQENKGFWSGFFFGLSLLVRYTNAVFAIPFFIGSLIKNKNQFTQMVFGYAPFVLVVAFYNYQMYGGIFSTGIKQPRGFSFWIMAKYLISLLAVYPLLILSPFFSKSKEKLEIFACFALALIGFSYTGIDTFHYDIAKNLVIGYRYLFPVIPLLLFLYVGWINQIKYKKIVYGIFMFACIILLVGDIFIMQKQYGFAQQNRDIMEKIYTHLPGNSLVLANGYVNSMFINKFFGDADAYSIRVYASSECPDIIQCNLNIEKSLGYAGNLSKQKQSYLVFAESGIISNEIKPGEASASEVLDERHAEISIAKRFNATLVFEEKLPNYIQIWKLP